MSRKKTGKKRKASVFKISLNSNNVEKTVIVLITTVAALFFLHMVGMPRFPDVIGKPCKSYYQSIMLAAVIIFTTIALQYLVFRARKKSGENGILLLISFAVMLAYSLYLFLLIEGVKYYPFLAKSC